MLPYSKNMRGIQEIINILYFLKTREKDREFGNINILIAQSVSDMYAMNTNKFKVLDKSYQKYLLNIDKNVRVAANKFAPEEHKVDEESFLNKFKGSIYS